MKIVNLVSQDGELMLHKWWRRDEVVPPDPTEQDRIDTPLVIVYARFKWLHPDQDAHRVFVAEFKIHPDMFTDSAIDLDDLFLSMGPGTLKYLLAKEQ